LIHLIPRLGAPVSDEMGDAIEENVWEGENEIDFTKNYKSDDEFEEEEIIVGEESIDTLANTKKSKKRKKFEAMKLKKKQKIGSLEDGGVDTHDVAEANAVKHLQKSSALTPEEMLFEVLRNEPKGSRGKNEENFKVDHFVFPDLSEKSTTKSEKNKRVCPFVRALSANMPSYRKLLLEDPKHEVERSDLGCPVLLILCASAIRATQIIKSMSAKLIKCKIAKLFAKHFKVEQQMEMLSKDYFPIALGTPNRVCKLIELGALSLRRAALVLIDVTPDTKKFTLLTLHEVRNDFYQLLHQHIKQELSHLKLALIQE